MCGGGSAKQPDPYATAQQQNAINRDALFTAAQLNQINQVSPFGQVQYSGQIGSPDRTQTVTLNPEIQKILEGQVGSTQQLTNLANQRLAGAPRDDFVLPENPTFYLGNEANNPLQMDVAKTGQNMTTGIPTENVQTAVDLSGQPQLRSDFENLANEAQDAAYRQNTRFLDPQFQQQEQQLLSRLSAQGITQGSDAYNQAVNNFARQKEGAYSSARDQAINQGFGLQNQLFGQSLAGRQQGVGEQFGLGNFTNQALAQRFGQNLENANLNNQVQNDIFGQNLAGQQAYNQAQGQQFRQGLDLLGYNANLYQQNLGNQILGRNQNINEAMSYLNGAPIAPQQPTFQPFPSSTAAQAAPDAIGLAGSNYANAAQQRGSILGSIFGGLGKVGAAAVTACWVAREVYGEDNPRWLEMRAWMLTKAPESLRERYLRVGPWIAAWIRNKPEIKALLREQMEAVLG